MTLTTADLVRLQRSTFEEFELMGRPSHKGPKRRRMDERFWEKVDQSGGPDACWPWLGRIDRHGGYGQFDIGTGRQIWAHRLAYRLAIGPIPEGLTIDHLCRVRHCVNPRHLEAVTNGENVLRGEGPSARAARRMECIHGHPYDEANTYRYADGTRSCRACARGYQRARRAARRAA